MASRWEGREGCINAHIPLSPPLLFFPFFSFLFFFFSLLITVHDRHAEREESNYGMVGEDISPRVGERKKRISRGCLWAVRGGDIFFFYKNLTYLFIVYGLSQFLTMHSIWLINILTFSPWFFISYFFKKKLFEQS